MGRFIQLVMGPAGVGKSSYCKTMQDHCRVTKRSMHVGNLDPAAEFSAYDAAFDIRDLVDVDEAMDELGYGPNGGLVYCMTNWIISWKMTTSYLIVRVKWNCTHTYRLCMIS
jgi:GPN-loop GTPase